MSFVPAIRDYIEMLNNVFDSLSGDINSQIIVKETLVYLFVSIKCILTYIFSFQWFRNVSYFPILVPQLHSSILNETYFLQNPVSTIFTFLETPTYGSNKLILGFLNSFFFCLPISGAHVICARRLLIQGIPAGLFSGLGTVLGQWWFATCILFGLRSFIIPWFSLEPLNFLIGFGILLNIIYEMIHERAFKIIKTKGKDKTKLIRFFLLNFILSWTEQCCFFQYFGNLTFGAEPTALETFSSNTEIQSFLIDGSYLLGLLAGSFFFTGLFGFLSIRLSNSIYPLLKLTFSRWVNLLNKGLILLTIVLTFTSIPYYGLDYLFSGPLGFISEDKALENTFFSPGTVENSRRVLFSDDITNSFNTDLNPFDRGNYLRPLETKQYQSFEDLNYQGEYAWTSQVDRQPQIFKQDNILTKLSKKFFGTSPNTPNKRYDTLPPKNTLQSIQNIQTSDEEESNPYNNDNILNNDDFEETEIDDFEETEIDDFEETEIDDFEETEIDDFLKEFVANKSLSNELVQFEDRIFNEQKHNDEMHVDDVIDENFLDLFFSNDPEISTALEEKIKQNYYSNPIYKSLLNVKIDSFLGKQPTFQKLTKNEEKNLLEKRFFLGSYYDTLRYYNQLPNIEQFEKYYGPSKSYADRVFNQQFKGTLKVVRRLFSITVDPEDNINDNPVLKFDQPLYSKENESNYKPFHEELSQKKKQKTPFLEISNSTPFYAGWDQGLRKLVITNRLLGRSLTGYGLYSPTKIKGKEYGTLSNFIDLNKKIEFTTWPLSKSTLEKQPKSLSNIPYNVLFESIKDPKNKSIADYLKDFFENEGIDPLDTFPSNLTRSNIENPEKLPNKDEQEPLKEVIPPNKGGFIWPGNSPLKFDLVSKFK